MHTHAVPGFVIDEGQGEGFFGVKVEGDSIIHPDGERYPFQVEYYDPIARAARLQTTGIDIDVLSIDPSFLFYSQPEDVAIAATARFNDAFAEWSRGDDRFRFLASLPLQAPEQAASELERAVLECGAVGAFIGSDLPEHTLDRAGLDPVFATVDRLNVPIVIHPVEPMLPALEGFHLTNAVGNPIATTIAATRLIFSGILDRFKNLKVVLVHGGGFFPYQLGRFDRVHLVRDEAQVNIAAPPSSYLDRFWIDTIIHSDAGLAFLANTVATGHLVLGTDFPFDMQEPEPLERLGRVGIEPQELGRNMEELFPGINNGRT